MTMPAKGRSKRWVLPAPHSPVLTVRVVCFHLKAKPAQDVIKELESTYDNGFFALPLPGECLQVCRKLSFPRYVPKCSYAIFLRVSPRCSIQVFYYFLKEKKYAHEN
jgi:hypothetical protein